MGDTDLTVLVVDDRHFPRLANMQARSSRRFPAITRDRDQSTRSRPRAGHAVDFVVDVYLPRV